MSLAIHRTSHARKGLGRRQRDPPGADVERLRMLAVNAVTRPSREREFGNLR